jgi:hypothetical protein
MYIIEPEPVSTAYFINPSHRSVCLYVYPLIIATQRLGKKETTIVAKQRLTEVIAATNTHVKIEDLLNVLFSIRSVSYQEK